MLSPGGVCGMAPAGGVQGMRGMVYSNERD